MAGSLNKGLETTLNASILEINDLHMKQREKEDALRERD
jgi:hypothetical protein